ALRQFGNAIKCTIPGSHPSLNYNYGCHCGLDSSDTWVDNLDRYSATWQYIYRQGMVISCSLCTVSPGNPSMRSYSYTCCGTVSNCRDKNNAYEAFICNCDRQATICFSKAPYNKQYRGDHC
ncbi:Phospholipase A2, partial [Lemmus lemmus]